MNDERTTAYLLKELTDREAEQFEDECFAQFEWPNDALDSAEQDLIQAYIDNELSPERKRRFEENYLTTDARKGRVLLARAFPCIGCPQAEPEKLTWKQRLRAFVQPLQTRSLVPRFAGVLVIVGLAAILLWYVIPPRAPQTFAHLNLVITFDNRSSGGATPEVKLPLAEDALRISLTLPEPASSGASHRVQWEDVKGPLEDLDIEKHEGNTISVIIPADELKRGQYTLKLFGKNPDGTEARLPGNYHFDVIE